MVDYAVLEFCIREYLNAHTPRAMAVLDPVKVVIENYPEDQVEEFKHQAEQEAEMKLEV